ncbi:MAG: helix-turn-helix domain-containing protein [Archaeoglobaceae archaeon]
MMSLKQMTKTLDCKSVLQCFFGLNSEDVRVYEALTMGFERIEDISKFVGKKENSVYKSLQKLLISGLAYREKRVIEGGGYYFVYKAMPKSEVAKEIENVLNELCEKVKSLMRDFLDSGPRLQGLRNLQ